MIPSPVAEKVINHLSTTLGPHTARVAVQTFTQKRLGRGPDTLTAADLPALLEGLKPMLNTLVGQRAAEVLVDRIRSEVNP